jgi:hypothetical protein
VKDFSKRMRPVAVAAAMAVAFGACDEQLNGGLACPALCPGVGTTMSETTFFAVDMDTSIAGFPTIGGELEFYVTTLGDTLQTAAALRFDSLPSFWRRSNAAEDSAVAFVDTGSYVLLTLSRRDSLQLAQETTVELYDIDMQGAEESDLQAVAAAFTPARLLTTITVDSLQDTLRVPIDPAFLLSKIQDTFPMNRVRLGVKVGQAGLPQLRIISTNGNGAAQLVFRPSPDTAVAVPTLRNEPFSRVPFEPFIKADIADYLVVIKGSPPPPGDVVRVGGLPARRTYFRFNIPSAILDSTNIVRATLFLTQRPNPASPLSSDTLPIGHFGVVAGTSVTDLTRALFFIQRLPDQRDTIFVVPKDAREHAFEMIDWVRVWRGTTADKTPRAIALVSAEEETRPMEVDFYSIEASPLLRPRLRLTYMPRSAGPLP